MQTSNETRIVPARTKDAKPGGSQTQLWREILETVLLTALVYFVVRSSVQLTPIDGPSMQPGLHTGESVLVNELAYVFGSPQRGDVIVFHPPTNDPSQQYIKRVIGVPGDTIQITDTAVIVDGVKLQEPYLNDGEQGVSLCGQLSPTLGAGDYFVMGDNRGNSDD
ncbi:MAG TPA: signal peptidase I, partial [Ktedonobacterales bacterium]